MRKVEQNFSQMLFENEIVIQPRLQKNKNRKGPALTQSKFSPQFNVVRDELCELGLLADGEYLDVIDLIESPIPSFGEAGYVYDEGVSFFAKVFGYDEGVIYMPVNPPCELYVPGGTIVDTIRHEFAHAWYWLDPEFINQPWFKRTFERSYLNQWKFGYKTYKLLDSYPEEWKKSCYYNDYVSPYAISAPYEDFAETFMTCLRYKNSLDRFKSRPGVFKKVVAVRKAIDKRAQQLGL